MDFKFELKALAEQPTGGSSLELTIAELRVELKRMGRRLQLTTLLEV
jgi:hypothetical protein